MKRGLRWVPAVGATLALCGLPFLAGADEATAQSDGRALYQEHCEVWRT